MSRFTIKDMPLINRHGLKRWDVIDDKIKTEIKAVMHEALINGNTKEKLAAGSLALRIDALNLKHESIYVPKADIDITMMSDEELKAFIEMASAQLPKIEQLKVLKFVAPDEFILTVPALDADDREYEKTPRGPHMPRGKS